MTKAGASLLGVVGGLAIVASIYGGIAPPPFLGSNGLLVCGILFLLGAVLLIASIALFHKSRISTVRIAMGDEAEEDAAALTKMEKAVGRGESAEAFIPEQKKEKLVVPPEVFSTLKEERTLIAKKTKKQTPVKKGKAKPIKLSSEILKLAKRKPKKKAAKKKK